MNTSLMHRITGSAMTGSECYSCLHTFIQLYYVEIYGLICITIIGLKHHVLKDAHIIFFVLLCKLG